MQDNDEAKKVYWRVLDVTNYFLKNAQYLTFESLKEFDPSLETIAKRLRFLAGIVKDLGGDNYEDEDMAMNAFQCCLIMEQIAESVTNNHEERIASLMKQLETHVKVP